MSETSTPQEATGSQLNRSCESCRSLKVRCLPNPSTPHQCQRCAKGKRSCIFVAPQRRRPRKRTDSRVAQLEKEMRVMRSLLKNRIPEEDEESEESDDDHEDLKSSGRDHSANSDDARYMDYSPELLTHGVSVPDFAFPAGLEEERQPVEDVIDRGILSIDDAEQLVAYYIHELAPLFPLVLLPHTTTAVSLRATKPVLFLSVIAATAISVDAGLAAVLNREIVRLYSERFFIEGEKSLELVQALLLMIVFYFPPASPLKLQFYQYTHIASTMALEIGLANKRRVKSDRRTAHDETLAEQARAVIGCYHLGSTVAMKTRRPNLLQFNDWMVECVRHLERSPHRTDQHLAIWFELQRITDEAMSSFGLDDTSTTSPLTESRVQAVLRWFDKRMEAWKTNTPSEMLTVPLILEYRSTALAMYELGVGEGYRDPDAVKKRYFTLPTPEGPEAQSPLSAIRIDINMKWMNAAHEMLDAVLACSTDTMRKLPNLMYTRLAMGVTSLLKIHFSVRTGALGEVVTPETVNVHFYLDAVANKLAEASGAGKYKIPSRWYQVIGVRGRDWYERLESRGEQTPVESMAASGSQGPSQSQSHNQVQSQNHGQGQGQDAMNVQSMNTFPVSVPMVDPRDGYVAMSGTGMWPPMDGQGHSHNPHFFMGYQQSPHAASSQQLPPQFAYEPQRMPAPAAGMELDGWLPDGSIFGMPPLPEF
ncbi:uncharacterized protein N7506_000726 [Penicillium brevicompactum]|uniref:uncharacterized protein n=1 Tax=Penicillium brevicompactum TaxID=5074 RepID=UPI00254104E3|nr:uncharacterized protein N7506_000726 [Penicillium brevicompactum]KAJ5347473.1 hypothetical protein N7506_000726 [Penicillium brevicompactum]